MAVPLVFRWVAVLAQKLSFYCLNLALRSTGSFLRCHSDFLGGGISHYTIYKVCIPYMSVES